MTNKRKYGGNLDKFEPGDLNETLCPNTNMFDKISEDDAEKVIEIAKKNEKRAIAMSNELMQTILA